MRRSHSGFRAIGFYLSALCTVALLFVLSIPLMKLARLFTLTIKTISL